MDTVVINGGSPMKILQRAISLAKEGAMKRGPYVFKALLLDSDKLAESPKGAEKEKIEIDHLAKNHGLLLIWQEPCHEGFLLQHLADCHGLRPPNCKEAHAMLLKQWPDYTKPMQVSALTRRIGLGELRAFVQQEGPLGIFLEKLGFEIHHDPPSRS